MGIEPLGERTRHLFILPFLPRGRLIRDLELVGWRVFLRRRFERELLSALPHPDEYSARFDRPDPVRQYPVQDEVCETGWRRVGFRIVPAQFVVGVEQDPGDDNGAVTQR